MAVGRGYPMAPEATEAAAPGVQRAGAARRGTLGLWVALLLVLGGFASVTAWNETRRPGVAPDFSLTSTGYEGGVQGEPVAFSLADFSGRTVVLDLMAVSCAPCRIVTREVLTPLWEEHGADPDFVLLSVDVWADPGAWGDATPFGESDEDLVRLQGETGAWWRHARDTDGVYRKYGVTGLPMVVVVDGAGRVVYSEAGNQDLGEVESVVEASLSGTAQPVPFFRAGTTGLAAVAGLAAFFAPCSIGLLPAYLGLLARDKRALDGATGRTRRTLGAGARVAAGLLAAEVALALLLLAFGPLLRPHLPQVTVATAVLLIVVGGLTLAGFPWDRLVRRRPDPGTGTAWAFGAAYGAAAFGCTGPILFPLLLGAFAEGPGPGLGVLAAYGATLGGLTLLVALLVAAGEDRLLGSLVRNARWVNRGAASLLVAGAVWLLWLEARAGVL